MKRHFTKQHKKIDETGLVEISAITLCGCLTTKQTTDKNKVSCKDCIRRLLDIERVRKLDAIDRVEKAKLDAIDRVEKAKLAYHIITQFLNSTKGELDIFKLDKEVSDVVSNS